MEVILLERVAKLGAMGDVVNVRPGFARNFLIPQKKALRATKPNKEIFEARRAEIEAQNAKKRAVAQELASKFEGLTVTVSRQSAEDGKLYGSVTSRDIASAIIEKGHKIERSLVQLDNAIRNVGAYTAKLALHPEVSVDVAVNVVRATDSDSASDAA